MLSPTGGPPRFRPPQPGARPLPAHERHLEPVAEPFRALAEAFVPEASEMSPGAYDRLTGIVEDALLDRVDRPRRFLAPVDFSCMGYSVPAAVGAAHLELTADGKIEDVLDEAESLLADGRPAVVEVAVGCTYRTYLTRGAVKTSFRRLPWKERLRMIGRTAVRKVTG